MTLLDAVERVRPSSFRRFAAWARTEPVLADLSYLEMRSVLAANRPLLNYDRKDEILDALVRLSRLDESAGIVLVSCLLPGLRTVFRRHRMGFPPDEAAAALVLGLWKRILHYPIERRPRKIAANLIFGAAHDLIVARDRERRWTEKVQLTGHAFCDRPDDSPPTFTLKPMIDAGVLTPRDVALLDATHIYGLPLRDVAMLLGMSYDAAKKARRRAELKLVDFLGPRTRPRSA